MIWEDTFYSIREITATDSGFQAVVDLQATHPIFNGHFPGRPVVPGVCTLAIVRKTISRFLQKKVTFAQIRECKFISAILPCENLSLTVAVTIGSENKITALVTMNESIALKLKATIN